MDKEKSEQFVARLVHEQEGLSQSLNEMRKERKDLKVKNIEERRGFIMKMGELSFIFGGAVIPLLRDFANGPTSVYLFTAIGLFILNGLVALWKSKTILEQDAGDINCLGLEEEAEVESYKLVLQKLINFPEEEAYVREWLTARESLVGSFTNPEQKQGPISFLLDGFVAIFVFGSALLTRVIWPFQQDAFLWSLAALAVLMGFLIVCSYFFARESRLMLTAKSERLKKVNAERAEWELSFIRKAKNAS